MSMRGGEGLNQMAAVGWEGKGGSRFVLEQLALGGVEENASRLSHICLPFPAWEPYPTFPHLSLQLHEAM